MDWKFVLLALCVIGIVGTVFYTTHFEMPQRCVNYGGKVMLIHGSSNYQDICSGLPSVVYPEKVNLVYTCQCPENSCWNGLRCVNAG